MPSNTANFDYYLRIHALTSQARSNLAQVTALLEGMGLGAARSNSKLLKMAAGLTLMTAAAGVTMRVFRGLTRGVVEYNNALERAMALGMRPQNLRRTVSGTQAMAVSGAQVITSAQALNIATSLTGMGLTSQQALPVARQVAQMRTGLMAIGGDTGTAQQIAGISTRLAMLRGVDKAHPEQLTRNIEAFNSVLFRIREALGDPEKFSNFADFIDSLPGPTRARLSAKGINNLAGFAAAGIQPQDFESAAQQIYKFAVAPSRHAVPAIMPLLHMAGLTNLLSISAGHPFQLNPALQRKMETDPIGFLQETMQRVRAGMERTSKGPVANADVINTMLRIFGTSPALANVLQAMGRGTAQTQATLFQQRLGRTLGPGAQSAQAQATSFTTAFQALGASISNLTQAMQFPGLIKAINILTKGINDLAGFFQKHPTAAAGASYGVLGGGLALGYLMLKRMRTFWKSLFSRGGAAAAEGGEAAAESGEAFATAKGASTAAKIAESRVAQAKSLETIEDFLRARGVNVNWFSKGFFKYGSKILDNPWTYGLMAMLHTTRTSATDTLFDPTTGKLRAGMGAGPYAMQGAGQISAPITINVNVNDPAAGRRIADETARQLNRTLQRGAYNVTTPAGVHMSPVFTGKQ